MRVFYEKKGRRYVEAGWDFTGFPCDGIWLVQDGKKSMTCLIGAKERVPVFALNYRQYANDLCELILALRAKNPISLLDEMILICDFFAEKAEKK